MQKHFPFTAAIFERSIKPIPAKLSSKGLPTDRGTKRAVSSNGPIDVRSFVRESSLAKDHRTLNGYGNFGRLALRNGRCCWAGPLPAEWTGAGRGASITELRQEQHWNNRSDKHALYFQTPFQKARPAEAWTLYRDLETNLVRLADAADNSDEVGCQIDEREFKRECRSLLYDFLR